MTERQRSRLSVDSSRCIPLVAVKCVGEAREADTLDPFDSNSDTGWMRDALPQHDTVRVWGRVRGGRIVPNRLGSLCWADWSRIARSSRFRHTPDSSPLTLPSTVSSRTIPLILHESWTRRLFCSGFWSFRPISRMRRRRGVDVAASRSRFSTSSKQCEAGTVFAFSRLESIVDTDRKGRTEQTLLPNRSCYWASCYRGIHECPMKMMVVRRRSEAIRSRPDQLSGEETTHPSATYDKGVGRTRP